MNSRGEFMVVGSSQMNRKDSALVEEFELEVKIMRRIWIGVGIGMFCLAGCLGGWAQQAAPGSGAASNAPTAAGSFPRLVRFGGVLQNRAAEPLGAAARVTFAIYEVQSGGAALWSEVQDVRLDAQGRYSVLLGAASSDGLPAELFSTAGVRWLEVQIEGRQEESRVLLVAVPYALKAADADTLGGKPATAFVVSDQLKDQVRDEVKTQVTQSGSATRTLVGTAPTPQALGEPPSSFVCAVGTDCVAVTQSGSGVGLHATTPTGSSVLGELSGTSGAAVYGRATAGTGAASAVQGDAAAPSAVGVLGRSFGTTGTSKGVFGRSFSSSGTGVHGDATTTTGATRGVWGTTASNGGVGVYGQSSSATGFTTGVSGTAASTSGVAVFAQAGAASGSTIGVQAKVSSPSGIAIVADNIAGGKIISGRINGVEKFSVDTVGHVRAAAYQDPVGNPIPLSSLPTSLQIRGITYLAGCDNCSPLTDADSQKTIYQNVIGPMIISSVKCFSDAGTPTINLQRDDGTAANILGTNLTCFPSGSTGTIDTNEDNLSLNDKIDFVMVTAGGVAKRVTVVIKIVVL